MLKEAPTDKILVPSDRVRKEFDKNELNKLAESFRKHGQIQPGVCIEGAEDTFILVAGERRLRAAKMAGIGFTFVLRDEADSLLLREIEVEENINRVDLTWQEEVFAHEELHKLRQERAYQETGKKQTVEMTAEELGKGRTTIQRDIEIAQWAREFEEVRDAKDKKTAEKVIKRLRANVLKEKFLENAVETAEESTARTADAPEKAGDASREVLLGGKKIDNEYVLELNRRIIHGKFEEEIENFKDGSVDVCLFDPPWGVDFDTVKRESPGTTKFEDGEVFVFERMEGWLQTIYKKMAEDSHLYMFFGIVHHSTVYELLEKVGFSTNKMPLIWYKQGAHSTRNPEIWPGRSYEPIAYARKGNKPLVEMGKADVILTPAPSSALKQNHPTAKHPKVYMDLLERSAAPGDTVLDPMCGSGMAGVAAETFRVTLKLDWWMIEKEKEFRDLSMMNVMEGYESIVLKKGSGEKMTHSDVEDLPEDFKELKPGGERWKRYWKENPEKQEEMLEWKTSQGS